MCLAGEGGGKGRLKMRSGVELTLEEDTAGEEVLKRLGNGLNGLNRLRGVLGASSSSSLVVIERLCFDWCSFGFP